MKHLFFIILFLSLFSLQGQETSRIKLKKYRVAFLNSSLKETSGLSFINNKLFTFNDGENPSVLCEINVDDGKILKTNLLQLPNQDWEAISYDGTSVYIGDFGNNYGTRKDLSIYQLNFDKDSVLNLTSKIDFAYTNQANFSQQNLKHDFDAEAMIYLEGKLHLFSKEWISKKTSHYIINPNSPIKQNLQPTEVFKSRFMVTDASYFNNELYLVGYTKKGQTFLLIFPKDKNFNFFTSTYKRYKLGSLINIGQIEGITVNEKGIYISGEGITKSILDIKPAFYFIPHSVLKNTN